MYCKKVKIPLGGGIIKLGGKLGGPHVNGGQSQPTNKGEGKFPTSFKVLCLIQTRRRGFNPQRFWSKFP